MSEEARETLAGLAIEHADRGVPRLKELDAVSLTVDQPADDDLVLRGQEGMLVLAVSRRLMERLDGEAELVVDLSEAGEPSFKLVRTQIEVLNYSGGETVRRLLFAVVGAVGVTVGVVVGVLFAPQKGVGDQGRDSPAVRSRYSRLPENQLRKAGQKIQPVVKLAGDRLPLGARAKGAADAEGQVADVGGEDDQSPRSAQWWDDRRPTRRVRKGRQHQVEFAPARASLDLRVVNPGPEAGGRLHRGAHPLSIVLFPSDAEGWRKHHVH